jgi:hypothetical protein
MTARFRCMGESWVVHLVVGISLILTAPVAAQAPPQSDSIVTRWARTKAIALPPIDGAYRDSAFTFLRGLVGDARILALGEPVHGGPEPLAFRNQVIRYAVTHLGFTEDRVPRLVFEDTKTAGRSRPPPRSDFDFVNRHREQVTRFSTFHVYGA